MNNPLHFHPIIIFFIWVIVSARLTRSIWRWRENRNTERITVEFKLLRGPGESLRRQIATIDNKLFSHLYDLAVIFLTLPVAVVGGYILSGMDEINSFIIGFFPLIGPLAFICAIYLTIKITRLLTKRRNLYLGYFGERVVSENLDTLRSKGAAIFHDVPLQGRAGAVNIDHVVVCPAGIFAIETKTRRKGPVRKGRIDGKITYDGAQLAYPWGEDTYGLSQAMTNALWLDKHIDKTGLPEIAAQPILTFPGWRIEQTDTAAACSVRVLTPAQIPLHLDALPPLLGANQIKHIAQQLETLCRDVEF